MTRLFLKHIILDKIIECVFNNISKNFIPNQGIRYKSVFDIPLGTCFSGINIGQGCVNGACEVLAYNDNFILIRDIDTLLTYHIPSTIIHEVTFFENIS
jgi:hypothetical protein